MEKTALSRRGFVAGAACAAVGAVAATVPALAEQAPGTVTVTASAQGFGGEISVTLTVDTASGVVVDAAIEGAGETRPRRPRNRQRPGVDGRDGHNRRVRHRRRDGDV